MIDQIVLLSGKVSSGKTTLAHFLEKRFGAHIFKTKAYLEEIYPKTEPSRKAMQNRGERLDVTTKGKWVLNGLIRMINKLEESEKDSKPNIVIVDAVRIEKQIKAIRQVYGAKVLHIHLDAPEEDLANRYANRESEGIQEFDSYLKVQQNPTESKVKNLQDIADVVIDTKRCTKDDVMVKAASHLKLYGRENQRLVDVLVGGQYGSEGKGHIASYLAKEYDLLIRVGGPNAGHTVYSEPEKITFHHLPSGTPRAPEAQLVIGPGATVYISGLLKEISENKIECTRLFIDPQTMIILDKDRKMEQGLVESMGSTGQGGGAAAARRILGRKPGKVKLAKDFPSLRPYLRSTCEVLEKSFSDGKKVFLEGTQGTGLSLYHGQYPYVTSRDTTVAGCLAEAGISASRTRKIIMVCRTYPIRVQDAKKGTSGPMSQPITWKEVEKRCGYKKGTLERKELTSTTHRKRRVGEFEWSSLRKAASLNAPTDIALTFVDYLKKENEKARRFEQLDQETIRFIEEIERVAYAPVSLISTRFDYRSIIDRRAW